MSSSICASPISLFRPISEVITPKSTLGGNSNNELETGDSHKDLLSSGFLEIQGKIPVLKRQKCPVFLGDNSYDSIGFKHCTGFGFKGRTYTNLGKTCKFFPS